MEANNFICLFRLINDQSVYNRFYDFNWCRGNELLEQIATIRKQVQLPRSTVIRQFAPIVNPSALCLPSYSRNNFPPIPFPSSHAS